MSNLTACSCTTTDFAPAGELAAIQADGLASGLDVLAASRRAVVVAGVRDQFRAAFPGLRIPEGA